MAGVQIVGKVQEYREQKALAASKRAANDQTRVNANIAYMRDINKIDQEKEPADQEKTVAKDNTEMAQKKETAENINFKTRNSGDKVQGRDSLSKQHYN